MAKRSARAGPAAGNDNTKRFELGPFWLYWREERGQWFIAWYDDGGDGRGRRTCRKATGIGIRSIDGKPPQEAQDALAEHYAAWRKPEEQSIADASVEKLIHVWLAHVAEVDADPIRARDAVSHWFAFFEHERKAGRITRGPYVADIKRALVERYIKWRKVQPGKRRGSTVSGATISRELAGLRAALRWAWQEEMIPSAPFIPDVEQKDKPGPKELVYTPQQVARLLEAARRIEERWHVHLFMMIMLSTHGRGDAILELDAETQLRDGLIYFNAPGRAQTKKRRSIVPIAPTLAPWLADISGKVIRYRTQMKDPSTGEWLTTYKPTQSIRTAFEACLIEAGICEQEVDEKGAAVWLAPRAKLGETQRRPKMRAIGSPNTLRHTIATELHKRGVPDAQIDAAAGHVGTGTNKKNYRYLRPDYLRELIAGVEDFWTEVGQYTDAHLRSQRDPNVIDLETKRSNRK